MNEAKKALKERDTELWRIAAVLGIAKYDSIRPCPRCMSKQRYVSNQGCVVCQITRSSGKMAKKRRLHMAITRQEAIKEGQRYFYPMHRCKHGHLARWRTKDDVCMMCVKRAASRDLHQRSASAEKVAADLQRLPANALTDEQIARMAGD